MSHAAADLVGELYGCLLHERPQTRALDLLCAAVGARHAVVMSGGAATGWRMATSHHLAANDLAGLGGISDSPEFARTLARATPGSFARMTALMTRQQLGNSDVYQQALRPLDGGLAACGVRVHGDGMIATAFCRSLRADADFDDDALATLARCMPHLAAVVTLSERMEHERRLRESAFDALHIVHDGVIVLGARGAVVHVNAAAEATLAQGDRLRRSGRGIAATDPSDERRLQQAVQSVRALSPASPGAVSPRLVLGKRRPGWPLIITLLPAQRALLGGGDGREVLLHVVDAGRPSCLSARTLCDEFGLTAREAALAEQLAHGATLHEAARTLEISVGTARQYLKAVFASVGVHSQADLLRIIRR
ncbi:hypothetical protein [Dyella sp.]|jgi:DNA-binding CsgD family transcriptional regulator/PAS domain-containing protein|uniref:helix-turn-helix transcriptional regulator n=1 Tax=Dyella sp. TaxID=1869338 RepID=UPI002D79BDEC|nr:hypothetical protein [Dyella sp.]HET6431756.1 hypothetical protein [Dyella sp.]